MPSLRVRRGATPEAPRILRPVILSCPRQDGHTGAAVLARRHEPAASAPSVPPSKACAALQAYNASINRLAIYQHIHPGNKHAALFHALAPARCAMRAERKLSMQPRRTEQRRTNSSMAESVQIGVSLLFVAGPAEALRHLVKCGAPAHVIERILSAPPGALRPHGSHGASDRRKAAGSAPTAAPATAQ